MNIKVPKGITQEEMNQCYNQIKYLFDIKMLNKSEFENNEEIYDKYRDIIDGAVEQIYSELIGEFTKSIMGNDIFNNISSEIDKTTCESLDYKDISRMINKSKIGYDTVMSPQKMSGKLSELGLCPTTSKYLGDNVLLFNSKDMEVSK